MKFAEALMKFQNELVASYGVDGSLVKIALEPELYRAVIMDLYSDNKGNLRFTSRDIGGEITVCGVQILARQRDNF